MEHVSLKMIPDAMKTSTIKVYQYQNKTMQGSFYNLYYGEEIRFENLMQLLLLMDHMMNQMNYPHTSMESRLIYQKKAFSHEALAKELLPKPDDAVLKTFHIRVIFRQNASWQGTVSWKGENQQQSFRSVLELIRMIDNVLSKSDAESAYASETIQ